MVASSTKDLLISSAEPTNDEKTKTRRRARNKEAINHCQEPVRTVLRTILYFGTVRSCPSCRTKIKFNHDIDVKKGLAHFINLSCPKCDWCATKRRMK